MKFKFMRNYDGHKRGDVVEGFLVNKRKAAIWQQVNGAKMVKFVRMDYNMRKRILVQLKGDL